MKYMAILMGTRFGHVFKGAIEFELTSDSILICVFSAPVVADLFVGRDLEQSKRIAKLNSFSFNYIEVK